MDKVIREGTLRLQVTESTCDVILSCKGHRLLAHKLILSIASPVFKKLLKQVPDCPSVVILPDISANVMSSILDYIYTGRAMLYTSSAQEFLSVAKFLQIYVDLNCDFLNDLHHLPKIPDVKKIDLDEKSTGRTLFGVDKTECLGDHVNKVENKFDLKSANSVFSVLSKSERKVPDLLPIGSKVFKKTVNRKLCNAVVPSPWRPRGEGSFLGDPRMVYLEAPDKEFQTQTDLLLHKQPEEDKNNNSEPVRNMDQKQASKKLDTIIRNLYLNNSESSKYNTSSTQDNNVVKLNSTHTVTEPKNITDNTRSDSDKTTSPKNIDLVNTKEISNSKLKQVPKFSFLRRFIQTTTDNDNNNVKNSIKSHETSTAVKFMEQRSNEDYMNTETSATVSKNLDDSTELDLSSNSNDMVSNDNLSSNESSNDERREHVTKKKKPYKCEDCGKLFSQLRNYKYHRSVHEGTKEFSTKCPECGKTFNDRGYLSSHMKIHRDKKEYACPHCPKRFNQRVAYNMHLRIHTGVKPHECPTCGKSFSRKMLLKQHQRVHTGERPYSCPECGKTFADRSNMSLHARLHTGVKPYACTLCPKSFTKKHHLKTHMNFHTGLKPYTCENCGLAFSQSSNMRTHYKKCILKDARSSTKESVTTPEHSS